MSATRPKDPRWALIVAVLGSSMAFLDGTIVNVALPVMQRELHASVGLVQWIVEAYALLLAALVLVGGALGDRLGRTRVFLAGVVVFALASIGCGASPNGAVLIAMRAVQGVGAALLVPGSLALITGAYQDKHARGAAIGTWSAASAVTAAVGPVAGGWVVSHASWRWLFFFNVPLAVAVILLALARVGETRDEDAPPHLDWIGATLAVVGLGLVVWALIESEHRGWNAGVVALFAAGLATLVAFVVAEARQRAPMVPLSLFRSRTFSGTNLLTLLLYGALGGGLFFVPFDLIQVQGYSPAEAGAALLPLILIISAMSRWMGGVAERVGPRRLLLAGPLVAGLGFGLLAVPATGGGYFATFFPGVVVLGVGMGITVAPLTAAVMGAVDGRHAGLASGINNAVSRAAALLAVAGLGVALVARFNGVLDGELAALPLSSDALAVVAAQRARLGGADLSSLPPAVAEALRRAFDAAYVAGFRVVMITCALLAAGGGVAAGVLVERPGGRPS